MKNLKLYPIVAVIACFTCSINLQAMDQEKGIIDKFYDGTKTVLSAAYLGAQRMYFGHAKLLEDELANPQTPISPWDPVSTTNKVNRALQQLEHNPARATNLLIQINAYNADHPNRGYRVSEVAMEYVRSGIEQYYATQESKSLSETTTGMADLKAGWRLGLQALIAQSKTKEKELADIAAAIKLVRGKHPDLKALNNNFIAIHTLPADLHLTLSAPEEEFTIDDIDADKGTHASASSSSSSSTATITAAALTKIVEQHADKKANPSPADAAASTSSSLASTPVTLSGSTAPVAGQVPSDPSRRLSNPSPLSLNGDADDDADDEREEERPIQQISAVTVVAATSATPNPSAESDSSTRKKKKKPKSTDKADENK
jgi:hypothetical protein